MMARRAPLGEIPDIGLTLDPAAAAREGDSPLPASGELPPDMAARADKLDQSGVLGRTPQPPPMALVGVAGKTAFLRTPDGQTGSVEEGRALRGVKVLKIGPNRVLVEHEGRESELTIFEGIGGGPLTTEPAPTPSRP